MYRFHFDVSTGKWLVQFLKLGIIWMTVAEQEFSTIEDARQYVTARGIDQHYGEQEPPRKVGSLLYGMGMRG